VAIEAVARAATAKKQGVELSFQEKKKLRAKHKAEIKVQQAERFRELSFIGRKPDSDSEVSTPPSSPIRKRTSRKASEGSAEHPIELASRKRPCPPAASTSVSEKNRKLKSATSAAQPDPTTRRGRSTTDLSAEFKPCLICTVGSGKPEGHRGRHCRSRKN